MLKQLYQPPLALLTDLYQLTMAYGYWKLGRAKQQSVFHLFFRKPPFKGGYAITAGLQQAVEYLEAYRIDDSDIHYLADLTGNDGQPLFEQAFLDELRDLKLNIDVDAMPEGTVAFGQEPMLRVKGPILQCQLLETPLLNMINFQTLIATKASRIRAAAGDDPVLEFGLRRAQGIDGALSASRAAYVGGCAATSNVLAGKLFSIPVKGTHAHSWVMSFDSELESFERYAEVMPNNCVFLVDTYDTLEGVRQACEVGKKLRERGHEMVGIRLDSGDLAYLSIEARKILDEEGFSKAAIVASNDLDEHIMENLKNQGAQIAVWGVGTKLATAFDQPALGGVYKLAAMQREDGSWEPKVKLSEQAIKTSIPGMLQVRRFQTEQGLIGDMIYDEIQGIDPRRVIVDSKDTTRRKRLTENAQSYDLLTPVMRGGARVGDVEPLEAIRARAIEQLQLVHPTIRRFMNPHEYPVGLDIGLHEVRDRMIHDIRGPKLGDQGASMKNKPSKKFQYEYPRAALTVDIVVFALDEEDLKVMLIQRDLKPFQGQWALPGGFVHVDETLDAAARRELQEETGLKDIYLEQLFTFGEIDRDPRERVVTVAYYALVNLEGHNVQASTDARNAAWFSLSELPELAFDHATILKAAHERLRGKVRYQPIGFELLPEKFTLRQLQHLYEVILDRELDKRNFRKKVLGMEIVQETDEIEKDVAHRAARLFRFDQKAYERLSKQGFHFEI